MAAKRVLLVDDDPVFLSLLQTGLSSSAWEIHVAGDALEGITKARELRPIVIISDIQMPAFGKGTDLLRAIRAEKAIANTPVIMVSGMEPDKARALLPQADARVKLLRKPLDFETLFSCVQEMTGIDGRRAP